MRPVVIGYVGLKLIQYVAGAAHNGEDCHDLNGQQQ